MPPAKYIPTDVICDSTRDSTSETNVVKIPIHDGIAPEASVCSNIADLIRKHSSICFAISQQAEH